MDVGEEFNQPQAKLPIRSAAWKLAKRKKDNMVTAKIPHMVENAFRAQILLKPETLRDSIAELPYRKPMTMEVTQQEYNPITTQDIGDQEGRRSIDEAMRQISAATQEISQGHLI
ncbi:hypothetical protein GCK32_017840 [Trichostrongylus colubriformis]|uniref:Uncharacterized protein n=1 Tax=Trichostrongylus colubriformis TaxID=6319 RepID=A0AAN8EQ28_TRICO